MLPSSAMSPGSMSRSIVRCLVGGALFALANLLYLSPAWAQGTMVRIQTTQGPIDLRLLDDEAPITVANFLAYVRAGDYADVMFHRLSRGFVLQGGGFRWPSTGSCCPGVTSRGPIQNEFSPTRSNLRGSVAMAKVGSNPNSATSQWFVNLANNASNLDNQNGGFTVFARVTSPGMAVVDKLAALPTVNAGSPFNELPVAGYAGSGAVLRNNVVLMEQASVLPPLAAQSESDRIFNYLEAAYPQYLSPSAGVPGTFGGYTYRYYSASNAYVGIRDGKVWYLVPSINGNINELGPTVDWLATAEAAGY
jgi:peptidyl-prolyl cis-trans isomerase A (cyclophilin A)